ncbi:hypothetical protein RP726_17925 [Candidatus Methylospira mobilis]|uniref:hypothetical protein n=1 Tax=Candidatus Methylospira mobilis TaxID=1808979 RepID=UPI0028EA951D|nr:hypothetical protein [Candidatus Methylospira mobilis]WNV04264.1 hypothetical protein RP726_17925 [Candidatus Methylospira mobilis]
MRGLEPTYMMDLVEGKFAGTSRQQLADIFSDFRNDAAKNALLIHFHGGLVDQASGIQNAIDLNQQYASTQTGCLFPIWETGLWEVLERNWLDIAGDTVFQIILDRVLSAVWAKTREAGGNRGMTLDYLPGTFLVSDLLDSAQGIGDIALPLADIDFQGLEPLTPLQEQQLQVAFTQDTRLTGAIQAAINAHVASTDDATRAVFSDMRVQPKKSAMDPMVLDNLAASAASMRGIPLEIALRVLGIVKLVIFRFLEKKDHGLHATAVEEILRAFYLATVGAGVWTQIKSYAHEAFQGDAQQYGGSALLEEIGQLPSDKKVLLVGHSAGSIFISELLSAAVKRNIKSAFGVIFLAPAARFDLFADALNSAGDLVGDFRMYTMTDQNECSDILVRLNNKGGGLGWFYPRSLLYLISGVLEPDVDSPIVGMQRFYNPHVWNGNNVDVNTLRSYVTAPGTDRVCWSVCSGPNKKLCANARSHGDFGHAIMLNGIRNSTVDAIREILSSGAF